MGAHGLHTEVEHARDIAHRLPGSEETEDLELAVRKTLVRRFFHGTMDELSGDGGGHARAEVRSAGRDSLDRHDQVRGRAFLLNVPGRPRPKGSHGEQLLSVHAQDENGESRKFALELPEKMQSVVGAESQIENHDVERLRPQQRHQLIPGGRFTGDHQVWRFGDDLRQSLSNDGVIIGDGDSHHVVHKHTIASHMPSVRVVLQYVVAIAAPLSIGLIGRDFAEISGLSPYLFFLCVALAARFFGVGPAVVCAIACGQVLWHWVFPIFSPEGSVEWNVLRVTIILAGSLVIGSAAVQAREAERRYRSLVELSPDGVCLRDDQDRILYANSALARMLGAAAPSQLMGRRILDFIHGDSQAIVAHGLCGMETGHSLPWLKERWVRLDGSTFDGELTAVPTRKNGRVVGHVFVRDLTERRRSESALDENRRRMKALFEASLDAILFVDLDGRYLDANPAACDLLAYSRDELLQMKFGDLSSPRELAGGLATFRAVRTDGHAAGEYKLLRKDGTTREVEFRAVSDNERGFHFAVMRDVTRRNETDRMLRQLSGQLLKSQDEERRRIARQLHEATAQSLIAVHLNLARVSQSQDLATSLEETVAESLSLVDQSITEIRTLSYLLHPPMIEEVGLVASLRWFVRGFEQRTGISVAAEVGEDLGELSEPLETSIFRIVQEAMTNIQRHSGTKAATVRLGRNDGFVQLTIEDHGRGLPRLLRGRPIESVAAAGVGIAGIYERVKELGGTLELHSDDHGTKIDVSVPA